MVVCKIQNDLAQNHGVSQVSVIHATSDIQDQIDFGSMQKAMSNGNDFVYHREIDMYLHKSYGCWFGCKFVLLFDHLVFPESREAGPRKQTESLLVS